MILMRISGGFEHTEVVLTSCESKELQCGLMWGPSETLTFGQIPLSPNQLQQTHLKPTAERDQPFSSWHKLSLKVLLSQRLLTSHVRWSVVPLSAVWWKAVSLPWVSYKTIYTSNAISALLFCVPLHNMSALMFSLLCPGMYFVISALIISLKDMQNLWCVSTKPIQLSPKITHRLQRRRLQLEN